MTISAERARLELVPVDRIERNPENPRLYFRPREMEELLESIRRYGIQVPVSVYRDGSRYVLIDGERRWRCASKLNMRTIPALVQDRPGVLENILLMFNIHAQREQWDLLTIALKLQDVITLAEKESGRRATEAHLAKETGLSRAVIRRSRYLLGLPQRYRELILEELKKPKKQQKLTEDFFIEMERALKTVQRAMPGVIRDKNRVRRVLIAKYRRQVIPNRVHFRQVAKIARAQNVGADVDQARKVLLRLFSRNDYSIERAYGDSVFAAYQERGTLAHVDALIAELKSLEPAEVDQVIRSRLRELAGIINDLLRGG